MWENFFKHVDVLPENVCSTHRIAPSPTRLFCVLLKLQFHQQFERALIHAQVHILDGNAGDGESSALQAECRRYCFSSILRAQLVT